MDICTLFDEFILYSFLGWIWETIYCTAKAKHWCNRGFLFGPICPIYGAGGVLAKIVFGYLPVFAGSGEPVWLIFLISAAGSAVLEFATSWVLEKRFHARWWDYSAVPLNVQGRISLPTTMGFGVAGVLIVKYLLPAVGAFENDLPLLLTETTALLLMGGLGFDFALTRASLTPLVERIETMQKTFDERAEQIVVSASDENARREMMQELEQKIRDHIAKQEEMLTKSQRRHLENIQRFHFNVRHGISAGERLKAELTKRRNR